MPAGSAASISRGAVTPDAKRHAVSVRTEEFERIDGRLSRVSHVPETLAVMNSPPVAEDPVGEKWAAVQMEEFFSAVLEVRTIFQCRLFSYYASVQCKYVFCVVWCGLYGHIRINEGTLTIETW